ncbi:YopX family protein [Brevibacillus sp. NPDC058079]|uniref:YopX family protein n=1 Tax=Brevibacillus sp. NPDC058079 TaxID=3346330 RepID=UPI0036F16BC5
MTVTKLMLDEQRVSAYYPLINQDWVLGFSTIKIMPYTGCVDNRNQKIYVGDVVQVTHMLVETIPSYLAIVEWDKYGFVLLALDYDPRNSFLSRYKNLVYSG